jgi:hypothetical protein
MFIIAFAKKEKTLPNNIDFPLSIPAPKHGTIQIDI